MIADLRAKAQIWVDVGDADKHDLAVAYLAALDVVEAARNLVPVANFDWVGKWRVRRTVDALEAYEKKQSGG